MLRREFWLEARWLDYPQVGIDLASGPDTTVWVTDKGQVFTTEGERPMETIRLLAMLRTMPPRYMRPLVEAASQTELNALNRVLRAWLGMPPWLPPWLKGDPTRTGTYHLLVAYRNKAQRTPL